MPRAPKRRTMMKRCSTSRFLRASRQTAVIMASLMVTVPSLSHGASATLNFNFNGVEARASALVAPTQAGSTATTYAPVFKNVQTTTEITPVVAPSQPQPVESAPATAQPVETAPSTPQPVEAAPATAQPAEVAPGGYRPSRPRRKGSTQNRHRHRYSRE